MRHLLAALSTGATCAALLACPTRAPTRPEPLAAPAPPPAPPVQVPPGCEASQAGTYHHAQVPSFRYRAEDDGGTLRLAVLRNMDGGVDAGTAEPTIVLQRTPAGFLGVTLAQVPGDGGTPCEVAFPTEVRACDDAGLTLHAVVDLRVDQSCRPLPAEDGGLTWKEQRLVREPPAPSP